MRGNCTAGTVFGEQQEVLMIEQQVREAIVAELERQAAAKPGKLKVERSDEGVKVSGDIGLDELVMAVIGSVAGGP